jgi:hypothetical protein
MAMVAEGGSGCRMGGGCNTVVVAGVEMPMVAGAMMAR